MAPDASQPDGDGPMIAPADWVREMRRHAVARTLDGDDAAAMVREERDAREQQVMRAIHRNA